MNNLRFNFLFLVFAFFSTLAFAQADPTLVQIDSGKIRGVTTAGVTAFKGIPFAQPPLGKLRWRAPQPVAPWDGVREAKVFGPDPLQVAWGSNEPVKGTSEDCLSINVWRPATASAGEPLPVLVWIYGGGLISGGASYYPGEFLARRGIVVVSFNYRVGRLGFFAHPALAEETPGEAHANYGYMDQIAALQWVKRNIAAFGGDPHNVTIAGESAGGGSVLVMLTSPMARGLFQRAIIQSAGIPTARERVTPLTPLADAEKIAVEYTRLLGIKEDGAAALTKLRALPAAKIAGDLDGGAVLLSMVGGPHAAGVANCILDGKLIVESPEAALRAGRAAKVPMMSGATDCDLAMTTAKTKEELFAEFGALAPQARKLYDPTGAVDFKALVQSVCADRIMIEPSRNAAELVAKSGAPAYFYRFSYIAETQRGKVSGAQHGADLYYMFGGLAGVPKGAASKTDTAMSQLMTAYWIGFIKTGDPNGPARAQWPRFDPATGNVFNFTNTGAANGEDSLKERLDLWRSVWDGGAK